MKKMKSNLFVMLFTFLSVATVYAQKHDAIIQPDQKPADTKTKIGIVLYSNDAETVWNAFRFANFALNNGDSVSLFLLGKGVEAQDIKSKDFDIKDQMNTFSEHGGKIMACGTCLRQRNSEGSKLCPVSSMNDLYEMVKTYDKILTF
jgi:sulfur relay (sulfurtransferase) complex TusBCD TusD component (DsrE family)